jgi:hypothetical protein
LGLVGAVLAAVELWFRSRERSPLVMLAKERTPWQPVTDTGVVGWRTIIPIRNFSTRYEATVRDVRSAVRVLYKGEVPADLTVTAKLRAEDPQGHADVREDGYWSAHIVTPGSYVGVELTVTLAGAVERQEQIHAIVVELQYEAYLRQGFTTESCEIVLPGQFEVHAQLAPVREADAVIYPIRTHILTDGDDMATVVERYVKPIAQPGDVVVAAESVVAIMQRRYRRPQDVRLGFWAQRLCYLIPNVGSLSTPWGFQCAIDDVGIGRMLLAVVVGAAFKAIGKNGWMYRIAGLPSELIDDVTGTMPPFDKYIVMGPDDPQRVVDAVKAKTGVEAAIADVNNLRRACIVAATAGVDAARLTKQLLGNPSGNASEQTPLVLVRSADAESERSGTRDQSCSV